MYSLVGMVGTEQPASTFGSRLNHKFVNLGIDCFHRGRVEQESNDRRMAELIDSQENESIEHFPAMSAAQATSLVNKQPTASPSNPWTVAI